MADLRRQLEDDILDNVEETNEVLGRGAYGEVKVVKYRDVRRAGKYFFMTLMSSDDVYKKCISECKQAYKIRHPNIVQTIGTFKKDQDRSLVLVMELLPYCLSTFVGTQERNLPEYIKLSILHDVSKGLSHLHSKKIMHRDLTANNILLTDTLVAKISDFGQSKMVDANTLLANQTPLPGSSVYMPPEALGIVHDVKAKQVDLVEYTFSIDVFSFGVLTLHVYTHELPQPQGKYVYESIGELIRQRHPIDYFSHDIRRAMADTHPLYPLLCQCLDFSPGRRPAIAAIVEQTGKLLSDHTSVFKKLIETSIRYPELVQEKLAVEDELREAREKIETMEKEWTLQGEENIKLKEQWMSLKGMVSSYKERTRSAPNNMRRPLSPPDDYSLVSNNENNAAAPLLRSMHSPPLTTITNEVFEESMKMAMKKDKEENNLLWEENQRLIKENTRLTKELQNLKANMDRAGITASVSDIFQSMREADDGGDGPPATVRCDPEVCMYVRICTW